MSVSFREGVKFLLKNTGFFFPLVNLVANLMLKNPWGERSVIRIWVQFCCCQKVTFLRGLDFWVKGRWRGLITQVAGIFQCDPEWTITWYIVYIYIYTPKVAMSCVYTIHAYIYDTTWIVWELVPYLYDSLWYTHVFCLAKISFFQAGVFRRPIVACLLGAWRVTLRPLGQRDLYPKWSM